MTNYLEAAIRTHILNDPVLASKLSDEGVYFSSLPQEAEPSSIVLQEVSGVDPSPTHNGRSGVQRRRFQFTIWTDCVLKRVEIKTRLDRVFDSKAIEVGGSGGVYCGRVAKVGQVDLGKDPGRNLYLYAVDFMFDEQVFD